MEDEVWKGVVYQGIDYSWRFECSNKGRIRNTNNKHVYIPYISGSGYYQICTTINGIRKNIKIHKAIAESFLPNPNNLRDVNHKDGDKLNNNLENLEWLSHRDNTMHAIKVGLLIPPISLNPRCGEECNLSKLTEEDVRYIRTNYIPRKKGNSRSNRNELSKMFQITPNNVYKIWKNELWKHIE